MSDSTFGVGFGAVQQAMDRQKAKMAESGKGFLRYIIWDTDETKILRFIDDDIITANFFEFVQTNQGYTSDFIILPGAEEDFARYINPATGIGLTKGNGDKRGQMVVPELRERTAALAVVLEEDSTGLNEAVREVDLGEKGKLLGLEFGIVKQSHKLFWSTMALYNQRFGTIMDRPYMIKRTGKQLDTDYNIIALDQFPDWDKNDIEGSRKAVKERYGYGREYDKDDPDRFQYVPMTLLDWAKKHASEERRKELLDPANAKPDNQPLSAAMAQQGPPPAWAQQQQPPAQPAAQPSPAVANSGLGEFHPATTQNPSTAAADEAQAAPPPSSEGDARLGSLRERLNKAKQAQGQ